MDWKNSTVAPSYPPGTSGNPVLKINFFVIFFDQPPTHDVLTAPSRCATAWHDMHIRKVDTLGFATVLTDWKKSTLAPNYPPGTSGNPVLKKNFFVIFLTNLRPIPVQPLQAGVRPPSTTVHIGKVNTLGYPTVQMDWKNSTVAPSYPRGTSGNPVLTKNFFVIFLTNLQPMTVRPLQAGEGRPSTASIFRKWTP